jgi:hypothetical protein
MLVRTSKVRKDVLIHAMVESDLAKRIEIERNRETRSSFVRRVLVRWYNNLPDVKRNKGQLEE